LTGLQVFDGGAGTDTLIIDNLYDPTLAGFATATIDLNAGLIKGRQLDGSTLLSIENLEVNTNMDVEIYGSAGDNEMAVNFGSPFKDTGYNVADIFAGDGNDTVEITKGWSANVNGGEGNDTIHITDATNFQAIGGNGDDTIEFTNIGGSGETNEGMLRVISSLIQNALTFLRKEMDRLGGMPEPRDVLCDPTRE
jgi:hypothetical protein